MVLFTSMYASDSEGAWKHVSYVIGISETSSGGSSTYQLILLEIYNTETLRSQNWNILGSSIWNYIASKFANLSTLGYSRMTLRHH